MFLKNIEKRKKHNKIKAKNKMKSNFSKQQQKLSNGWSKVENYSRLI